jgi:aryl sulfotransferase
MPELQRPPERIVESPVLDSHRWDAFQPRDGDIVIGTFPKCGTTWTQRIVDLLVFQSPDVRPFGELSPWLDSTIFNPLEQDLATLRAQTHRRFIKSHLPFDALPVWDTVKYIYVGRDGRDAELSWQNHEEGFLPEFIARSAARAMALAAEHGGAPAGPPPARPKDPRAYLLQWFDELDAALDAPGEAAPNLFSFAATYWRERKWPNLLIVHYNDLKEDLEGEMRRISDFLGIDTPQSLMPSLAAAATFETMKKDGEALLPNVKQAFDRGADRFLNKGRSGRWREYLTREDVDRYEAIVSRATTPGLARWLQGGRRAGLDPTLSPD